MNFQTSDKVVCVDVSARSWWDEYDRQNIRQLRVGQTYVVSDVFEVGSIIGLHLIGLSNKDGNGAARGWDASRFRLLSEIQLCVRAAKTLSNPVEEEIQSV